VLVAGLGTLVIAFGLFVQDPRVVVGAQVATIFGVTVLNIALTRYLHDAMPSTVRAGASSVVSTIGYGAFVPVALGFGVYSRSHGIFAASVFVVVPLGVMCLSVGCARAGGPSPPRSPSWSPFSNCRPWASSRNVTRAPRRSPWPGPSGAGPPAPCRAPPTGGRPTGPVSQTGRR